MKQSWLPAFWKKIQNTQEIKNAFPSVSLPHSNWHKLNYLLLFFLLYIAWKRGLPLNFAHFVLFRLIIKLLFFNLLHVLDLGHSWYFTEGSRLPITSLALAYQNVANNFLCKKPRECLPPCLFNKLGCAKRVKDGWFQTKPVKISNRPHSLMMVDISCSQVRQKLHSFECWIQTWIIMYLISQYSATWQPDGKLLAMWLWEVGFQTPHPL